MSKMSEIPSSDHCNASDNPPAPLVMLQANTQHQKQRKMPGFLEHGGHRASHSSEDRRNICSPNLLINGRYEKKKTGRSQGSSQNFWLSCLSSSNARLATDQLSKQAVNGRRAGSCAETNRLKYGSADAIGRFLPTSTTHKLLLHPPYLSEDQIRACYCELLLPPIIGLIIAAPCHRGNQKRVPDTGTFICHHFETTRIRIIRQSYLHFHRSQHKVQQ